MFDMRDWCIDLHLHTILSPCGSDDMIPPNVLAWAKELGINALAITDHNTAENVASFMEKGKELDLLVLPGMEVQTSEDIHLVSLFESLDKVMEFQELVYTHLPDNKNKKEFFGEQWIVDKNGNKIKELERMLLVGINLSVEETVKHIHRLGGICIASHIDRQAFSLWGHLGYIPDNLELDGIELTPHLPRNSEQLEAIKKRGMNYIVSSDAHYLSDMKEKQCIYHMKEISFDEIKKAINNIDGRYIKTLR